jgi:hypothetical protein
MPWQTSGSGNATKPGYSVTYGIIRNELTLTCGIIDRNYAGFEKNTESL